MFEMFTTCNFLIFFSFSIHLKKYIYIAMYLNAIRCEKEMIVAPSLHNQSIMLVAEFFHGILMKYVLSEIHKVKQSLSKLLKLL